MILDFSSGVQRYAQSRTSSWHTTQAKTKLYFWGWGMRPLRRSAMVEEVGTVLQGLEQEEEEDLFRE